MPDTQRPAAGPADAAPGVGEPPRPAPTGAPTRPVGPRDRPAPLRPTAGDIRVRGRVLRLAVIPAILVAAIATAVITLLLRAGGAADRMPEGPLWTVLGGALVLVCVVVAAAAYLAAGESRAQAARVIVLRRHTARARGELREVLERVGRGERVRPPADPPPPPPSPAGATNLDLLAHEIAMDRYAAHDAIARATSVVRERAGGSDEKVEVFGNLARRLQSLVHREIEQLDELENRVEDPELLKGLFQVDHLATRIRRYAENLAVLGGAVPRRQWTRPVGMTEVLRSAIAEVEHYSRVKLVPPVEGTLRGHAVADVIHLLAELVENATTFSSPQTVVLLRSQHVTAGLAIEVEDRGLGMPPEEQIRMNALLSGTERIEVEDLLRDGRIGLFVVSELARRHHIVVQLQSNIYGGIQAVLVIPRELLGDPLPGEGETRGDGAPLTPGAGDPGPPALLPAAPVADTPRGDVPAPGGAPVPGKTPEPVAPAGRPTPAHGPVAAPAPVPTAEEAGEASAEDRPDLPRRRRQEHLAPELRGDPPPREAGQGDRAGHDPGLMAAFLRGVELAERAGTPGESASPGTGGPAPAPPPDPNGAANGAGTPTPPAPPTSPTGDNRGEPVDHGE
ncbi:ATP-binding protein [Streptomyces calidiresistens]